jgi:hypothetical protein
MRFPWIINKDINVMANAMADLQHKRRAAAKRPINCGFGSRICLINDGQRYAKQVIPVAHAVNR